MKGVHSGKFYYWLLGQEAKQRCDDPLLLLLPLFLYHHDVRSLRSCHVGEHIQKPPKTIWWNSNIGVCKAAPESPDTAPEGPDTAPESTDFTQSLADIGKAQQKLYLFQAKRPTEKGTRT